MKRIGVAIPLLAALTATPAPARDNSERVAALGFQAAPVGPVRPGTVFSLKFAAVPEAEFAALLGFTVEDGFFSIAFGGKALLILIPEERLNLYLGGTLLPSIGTLGLHTFSYFLGPGLSYYPPGTENLEVFAEFGLGGGTRFGQGNGNDPPEPPFVTTAGALALGLHYWF